MKNKPWPFKFVVIVLLGIIISFPIQIQVINRFQIQWWETFHFFSIFNWIVIGLCIINLPFLWNASRWVLLTMPLLFFSVLWNNIMVGSYSWDFSYDQTLLATLGFCSLFLLAFHRGVQDVLSGKPVRWWSEASRKPIEVPVKIYPGRHQSFQSKTVDLSTTGMFVKLKPNHEAFSSLVRGERINVNLQINDLYTLKCEAEVVRDSKDFKGKYPPGFGFRFINLRSQEKKMLKKLVLA